MAEFCTDAALQVGQTLYLKSKSGITRAEILSLQINGIEHSKLQAKSKQEVGMRLSSRGFLRAEVYALDPTTPLRESKQKEIQFADEVGIAVGIAEAADADSELEAALQGVDLELTDIDPTELEAALADPTLGSPLSNLSPARANLSSPASSASITTETQGNDAPKPDDLEKD